MREGRAPLNSSVRLHMNQKINCNGVRYRQGFIEIVPGIHPHHINLKR
jgi:hypothetical protein